MQQVCSVEVRFQQQSQSIILTCIKNKLPVIMSWSWWMGHRLFDLRQDFHWQHEVQNTDNENLSARYLHTAFY